MDRLEQFHGAVQKEMTMTLATAAGDSVTMRVVSPVLYEGGILIFTGSGSTKYIQLQKNPHCCVAVGTFFAECDATLLGSTLLEKNSALRDAYSAKFPGAFDESVEFGGRAADFVLLKPRKLKGWAFVNDIPTADGIPNLPFEIEL